MSLPKQIVIKASFATTTLALISLVGLPTNAGNQSQKCTYENNRTVCTKSGSNSTHSSSSSSSLRTINVDVDVSEKDVENLFQGIFNDRSRESHRINQNSRPNSTTETFRDERKYGW